MGTRSRVYVLHDLFLVCLLLLAPSAFPRRAQATDTIEVGKFSTAQPGGTLPEGWRPWILAKGKRLTEYSLVADEGTVVVKAIAENSASGLVRKVQIDLKEYPIIEWRWKVANLIPSADNTKRFKEDSPARLYIGFEGDIGTLPRHDQLFFRTVKFISGQELPFATLNYIWENRVPKETVIANPNTDRIQMIVVESGPANVGQWVRYERNVYDDYKRAFGQDPPALLGVFLMTDTDNTDEATTAYYGDISFRPR